MFKSCCVSTNRRAKSCSASISTCVPVDDRTNSYGLLSPSFLHFTVARCANALHSVGFDGSRVWAMERAQRALCKRYNLVNMSRRSLSYETRLAKYSRRGYAGAITMFRYKQNNDIVSFLCQSLYPISTHRESIRIRSSNNKTGQTTMHYMLHKCVPNKQIR